MAYVRTKEVNGNYYKYLVKGERVDGKVKQKVLQYLGPADGPDDTSLDPGDVKDRYKDNLGTTHAERIKTPKGMRERAKEVYEGLSERMDVGGYTLDFTTSRVKTYNMKTRITPEGPEKIRINWNLYERLYSYDPVKAEKHLKHTMAHEMAHIEQFRKKEKEEFFRAVRMLEYGDHSLEEEVEGRVKEISGMTEEEALEIELEALIETTDLTEEDIEEIPQDLARRKAYSQKGAGMV